jgi:hypothetical protein
MTTWILIASLFNGLLTTTFSSKETCIVAADLIILEEDRDHSWVLCVMK